MNPIFSISAFIFPFLLFYLFPIFLVYKMAIFKKRNKVMWTIFAIINYPIALLILYLLPSLQTPEEKNDYLKMFTSEYGRLGYILFTAISVFLLLFFYSKLVFWLSIKYNINLPEFMYFGGHSMLVPALQSYWLNIHVPFGIIAYSAILTSYILCLVRLIKNTKFPKVILSLQLSGILLFSACILTGAIWANHAWGRYWGWDPKETCSLTFLYVMIMCYMYLTITVQNKIKNIVTLTVQLFILIILILAGNFWTELHSYGLFF